MIGPTKRVGKRNFSVEYNKEKRTKKYNGQERMVEGMEDNETNSRKGIAASLSLSSTASMKGEKTEAKRKSKQYRPQLAISMDLPSLTARPTAKQESKTF